MSQITLTGSTIPYCTVEPQPDMAPHADPRRGSCGNGVKIQRVNIDGEPAGPPLLLTSWGAELLERQIRVARTAFQRTAWTGGPPTGVDCKTCGGTGRIVRLTRNWPQWWHNTIIWLANLSRPADKRR